jgi:hypothetical protein
MSRFDNVTNYFINITQVCDQLVAIKEKLDDVDLISVVYNGFSKSCQQFVNGLCTWEKLLDWKRIWDHCIQEETWEESKII